MATRGVIIFAVLDCCHSGGAVRDDDPSIRRADIGLHRQLEEHGTNTHLLQPLAGTAETSVWWQRPMSYTVLAACQPQQKARETHRSSGDGRTVCNGVLTHWMLEGLRLARAPESEIFSNCQRLHRFIIANVVGQYFDQHPIILGVSERAVFGSHLVPSADLAVVTEVEGAKIKINVGEAHMVSREAIYTIYDWAFDGSPEPQGHSANGTVYAVRALSSWLSIPRDTADFLPRPGCVAILQSSGGDPINVTFQTIAAAEESDHAFKRLQQLLEGRQDSIRPMHLHRHGEEHEPTSDYQVHFSNADSGPIYAVPHQTTLDSNGHAVSVHSATLDTADGVWQMLQRLVLYQAVKGHQNSNSTLGDQFEFTILGDGDVMHGRSVHLELHVPSKCHERLHFAIFDITPSGSVNQIYPPLGEGTREIGVGQRLPFPMKMTIPDALFARGVTRACDIIKVIVTTHPSSFPMFQSADVESQSRDVNLTLPFEDWQTKQVEVWTYRT